MNETHQKWTDLFDEIENLMHWIVQQESKEKSIKKTFSARLEILAIKLHHNFKY